ncbi:MAG: hypothetical protein ACE5EF_03730 [Dehalococcoidia bacterium]
MLAGDPSYGVPAYTPSLTGDLGLLSVSAAYGLLVLVFQEGIGAGLLGFRQTEVIEPWLPLFLFTILFGLGVAVILDATVIRSVLVPATMELLGSRNWYFPAWLEWLPEIHIEGRPEPRLAPELPVSPELPASSPMPMM